MAGDNPFEIGSDKPSPITDQDMLLAEIGRSLRQTQPWVLLIAALAALGALLLGGVGVMMFAIGGIASNMSSEFGGTDDAFGGLGALMGVFYLVFAGIYTVPAVLMGRFGFAISGAGGGNLEGIARAVKAQRDLWIFVGAMTLLILILYCAGAMAAVLFGMSAANP